MRLSLLCLFVLGFALLVSGQTPCPLTELRYNTTFPLRTGSGAITAIILQAQAGFPTSPTLWQRVNSPNGASQGYLEVTYTSDLATRLSCANFQYTTTGTSMFIQASWSTSAACQSVLPPTGGSSANGNSGTPSGTNPGPTNSPTASNSPTTVSSSGEDFVSSGPRLWAGAALLAAVGQDAAMLGVWAYFAQLAAAQTATCSVIEIYIEIPATIILIPTPIPPAPAPVYPPTPTPTPTPPDCGTRTCNPPNGTCVAGGICQCVGAWGGPNCDQIPCPGNCNGQGTCTPGTATTDPVCDCVPGYSGVDCSIQACPKVNGIECNGAGSCLTGICYCSAAYSGSACEITCADQNCGGNGVCNRGTCACNLNWRGENCTDPFFECPQAAAGYCCGSSNGVCDFRNGTCTCLPGWAGDGCCLPFCPVTLPLAATVDPFTLDLCFGSPLDLVLTGTGLNLIQQVFAVKSDGSALSLSIVPGTSTSTRLQGFLYNPGTYTLLIRGANCTELALPYQIFYESQMFVFYTTPRFVYAGLTGGLQITVWVTGLTGNATSITVASGSTSYTYTGSQIINYYYQPGRPRITIPNGAPLGNYSVTVVAPGGCSVTVPDVFMVVGDANIVVNVTLLDPPFVWNAINTGILIRGNGFKAVPEVVASPSGGGGAILLKGTVWFDRTKLQSIVPGRAFPGQYNILVVNSDGTMGLLRNGLTVITSPPPVIERIIPGYLNTDGRSGRTVVSVLGANFQAGATFRLDCQAWDDPTNAISYTNLVQIQSMNSTLVSCLMDGNAIGSGFVCVVRIINPDTAYFDFSAIVTRNPSNKLAPWQDYNDPAVASYNPAVKLNFARRGARMVAGSVTSSSKYLYICGGDFATLDSAYSTCEFAPLDKFGNVLGFTLQSFPMTRRLTFGHMSVVSRFVYWTGGWDADRAAPIRNTYRAEILDPLKTPEAEISLTLEEGATGGFNYGLYYYRVSAYFAVLDVNNPDGESLCGEVLSVYIPPSVSLFSGSPKVVITWDVIPDAIGYNVYRTPRSNMDAQALEYLGSVIGGNNTIFFDYGQPTLSVKNCLPQGSLGRWHEIWSRDLLSVERWGHVSLPSPSHVIPNDWFLSVLTGKDSQENYLATYEAIRIRIIPDPIYTKIREFQIVGRNITGGTGYTLLTNGPIGPVTDPRFLSDGASVDYADLPGIGPLDRIHVVGIGFTGNKNRGVTQKWLAGVVGNGDSAQYRNNVGQWANTWQVGTDPSGQNYGYCLLQAFGLIHQIGGVDGAKAPFGTTPGVPLQINAEGRILPNPGLCGSDALNVNLDNVYTCSNWAGEPNLAAWQIAFPACSRANGLFFMAGGQPDNSLTPIKNVLRSSN